MRNFGLWVSNGPPQDIDTMLSLVKDGAYTVLHEGHGAEQARLIHARYPSAVILVRHHCPDWPTTDPARWAQEVAGRMARDYASITVRLVGANEPNLEPKPNFTEENYRAFGRWYQTFAREIRRQNPSLLVHFPAWAAGHSEDQNDLGFVGYLLPEVREAIALCHAVNCHCYWDPAEGPLRVMGNYGGGLRYRKVRDLLRGNGLERPIWVDEAGPWAEPWRVEQTAAHSDAVRKDRILGCTYFLWADPTNNPGNTINQWRGRVPAEKLQWLAQEWDRLATLPEEAGAPGVVDVVDKLEKHPTLRYEARDVGAIRRIVIHHSAARGTVSPEAIARYHVRSNGWPGIGYHYYIPADGTIYQTNALTTVSYHAREANSDSVGICFGGDFTQEKPTAAQMDSGRWLIGKLLDVLGLSPSAVFGHGDLMQTQCPGGDWWKSLLPEDDVRVALSEIGGELERLQRAVASLASVLSEMQSATEALMKATDRLSSCTTR